MTTMNRYSGYYRKVPQGTPNSEWAEGCGYIIYDKQAFKEGRLAAKIIAERFWKNKEKEALSDLYHAREQLNKLGDINDD